MHIGVGLNLSAVRGGGYRYNPLATSLQAIMINQPIAAVLTDESEGAGDVRPIQRGRCYVFDGVNDYVVAPDIGADRLVDELEFWAYMDVDVTAASPPKQVLNTYHPTKTYTGLVFGGATVALTGETFAILNDGVAREAITDVITAGWHHYRIVWTGTAHEIYIDGDLGNYVATGTPVQLNARRVWMATRYNLRQWWAGKLFGLKITSGGVVTHLFKCDEGAGTTAFNSAGNGNHGTIANATLATFHGTQDVVSWQNDVGYSEGQNLFMASATVTGWVHQLATLSLTADHDGISSNALRLQNTATTGLHRAYYGISSQWSADKYLVFRFNPANSGGYFSWQFTSGSLGGIYRAADDTWLTGIPVTDLSTLVSHRDIGGGWFETVFLNQAYPNSVLQIACGTLDRLPGQMSTASTGAEYVDVAIQATGSLDARYVGTKGGIVAPVKIPRNEANPTQDVLGNPLQYTGRVPYNARFVQSHCATFDGVDDYIAVPSLTGSETVSSYSGTGTPSIAAGRINCTAGTLYHVTLSNGSVYPMAEGAGTTIYDVSGNGNHGTITNATEAAFWGQRQDTHHWNVTKGFTLSGGVKVPALPYIYLSDGVSRSAPITALNKLDITVSGYNTTATTDHFIMCDHDATAAISSWCIEQNGGKARLMVVGQDAGETEPYVIITGTTTINDGAEHDIRFTFLNGLATLYVDGVSEGSATVTGATTILIATGAYTYDHTVYLGTVPGYTGGVFAVYGVSGNGVSFVPDQDALGNPITNPAGIWHNGAETKIDFTGGVLSPAAVAGSWETAWAPFDARTNPKFRRALTDAGTPVRSDRFLTFGNALTGADLSKAQSYTASKEV